MAFTKDDFAAMFGMLMHRDPRPGELDGLWPRCKGIAEDAVCVIAQIPEFVRLHPSLVPRPLNDTLKERVVNGISVLVPEKDWVYETATTGGTYEKGVADAMRQVLGPGSVFLDVGANIGMHSALASHLVGREGRVYAVEASIEVASVTLANARHAGLDNMLVVPIAVTDKKHAEFIMVGHAMSNRFVVDKKVDMERFNFEPLLTHTLDSLLGHLDRLDLIKIDIEGREGAALRGAEELLRRFRPKVIAEHHFASPERWFVEEMVARDYEMTVLSDGVPVAVGQDIEALKKNCTNDTYVDIFFSPREAAFALADTRPRTYSFAGDHKRVQSTIGVRKDGALLIEARVQAYAMHGPYLTLPPGKYRATVDLATSRGTATMDVCHKQGTAVLARGGGPSLDFTLPEGSSDLEIRLLAATGFTGIVRQVSVAPLD